MQNGTFKKKRIYFSQVSNTALRDPKLSLKAKGLYALIQSYITIEDFVLYKNTLKRNCPEGEKAFENTWKELKDSGYLLQEKHRNNGQFFYEYELLDAPHHTPQKEGVGKAGVDKGGGGKGGPIINTDSTNTDLKNTDSYKSLHPSRDAHIQAYRKAFKDTFGYEHRDIKGTYEAIYNYEPQVLYDFLMEYMEDEADPDRCTIDYFETIQGRFL